MLISLKSVFLLKINEMKKAILYTLLGTTASFLFSYFLYFTNWQVVLFQAFAFGFGWGMAYYVDHPDWKLSSKLGISFIGIAILIGIGLVFFEFEIAVPSVIRYSTVFLVYYLIGSFKDNKSLRS